MTTLTQDNIKFLAIARATDKAILCSYIHRGTSSATSSTVSKENLKSYLEMMHKVLCAPTWKEQVEPNSRHTLDCSPNKFHFTMDQEQVVYVVITAEDCPIRLAFKVTEALKGEINPKFSTKVLTCKENGLEKDLSKGLKKIAILYDDRTKADKVSEVMQQVDNVKVVMHDSIQTVLSSTEKMETVEQKANELNEQAKVFRNTGRSLQRKMWWKNMKLNLLIGFILIAGLLIILLMSGVFNTDSSTDSNPTKSPALRRE